MLSYDKSYSNNGANLKMDLKSYQKWKKFGHLLWYVIEYHKYEKSVGDNNLKALNSGVIN